MVADFNQGLPYVIDVDQGPTCAELQDINFADQIDGSGTLIETAVLFKGAIDPDCRIRLDLTLKDSSGSVLASYSRDLEDVRQDYQEEQVGALLMTTPTDSHVTVSLATAMVAQIDRIEVELQEF